MWDKIQKIIADRKNELDLDQPDGKIWDRIENTLDEIPKKSNHTSWWKVAAVLILVSAFAFYFIRPERSSNQSATTMEWKFEEKYPEIANAEQFYLASVQSLQMQIEASEVPGDSSNDLHLIELDSAYADLKVRLAQDVNREKVIAEMVHNLQLRIHILQQQLMLVKEFDKRIKEQEDEKPFI